VDGNGFAIHGSVPHIAPASRRDLAPVSEDVQTAAAAAGGIGTANTVDAEEVFVVDVLDNVADLIGVCL
jgi:hypothetical protein